MSNLFNHYNRLSTILQKIIKSQNEDIQLLITDISSAQEDTNNLKIQLDLCATLEKQMQEELDYYKQKDKAAYIYGNIITPLPGLMLMTYGFIEMGNGNTDKGWDFFKIGAFTLAGMELVYQGGHWLFRVW